MESKKITLEPGDFVYSTYFKEWLEVGEIRSDDNWTFTRGNGTVLKAQTPLSYFINTDNFRKVQRDERLSAVQRSFIIELAHKMATQSNRATQYPLFVIQVDVKEYGDRAWCNEVERKEESDGDLCEACQKKSDEGIELPDWCDDCDSECFVWFNWGEKFDLTAGVFFTEKECEAHIRANHYHYLNPKSYVVGCFRNYEMDEVMRIIFTLASVEIPSCYK